MALVALAAHPVAGIPALLFALAMFIYRRPYPRITKKILYSVICLLAAGVLPFLFYLTGQNSAAATGGGSAPAGFALPGIVFPAKKTSCLILFIFSLTTNG